MTKCRQIDGVKEFWNHCVFRDDKQTTDRWDVTISTFYEETREILELCGTVSL